MSKTIKGFEGEDIICSDFGEWVEKNYIDYKSEYKNQSKVIDGLYQENIQLKRMLNIKEKFDKKEVPYEWEFKDMFDIREENRQLKQQLKDKDEKISKIKEYCLIDREDINGSKCDDILEIIGVDIDE